MASITHPLPLVAEFAEKGISEATQFYITPLNARIPVKPLSRIDPGIMRI